MKPEDLARTFHATYERLAPEHGYKTRTASAVPWDDVPEANKNLMIAVAGEVLPEIERAVRTQVAAEIDAARAHDDHGPKCGMAWSAQIARGETQRS